MYSRLLMVIGMVLCMYIHAEKVLIITHAYNRPEFIAIQKETFTRFLADDFEYVVFNDARSDDMELAIRDTCNAVGVRCIRIPQEIHTRPYLPRLPGDDYQKVNIRHANNVQYSCDVLGFDHDGIVLIIDSDMFLVRLFDITAYMQGKYIAGLVKGSSNGRKEVEYICPALCFLYMNRLPDKYSLNFNFGYVEGNVSVDSGGWTYYYLKNHSYIKLHEVSAVFSHYHLALGNTDCNVAANDSLSEVQRIELYKKYHFNEKEITFLLKKPNTIEYFLDNCFFHYHGGSNYTGQSNEFHEYKTTIFKEYIADILS